MTAREAQVAFLVADGRCAAEIAAVLGVSRRTVKARKQRAARSLGYRGKRLDVFLVRTVHGLTLSRNRLERFPPRLRRTAELVSLGMTNPEISQEIGKSLFTIQNQLREIFDEAGVWNRRELARLLSE